MKRNKSFILGSMCLVLMIVALPFMAACGGAAPAGPIELKYALHTPPPPAPPGMPTADQAAVEYFAQEVGKRTEGRVTIKFYYSAVLGKPTEYLDMVGRAGVADMANIVGSYNMWKVPLFSGALQPFLTNDVDIEGRAVKKLFDEWKPMREEWEGWNVKPLWWYVVEPYWFAIKKPITTLDDLKGEKAWGAGGFGDILQLMGITQVAIPAGEAYDALQKGVLQGVVFPYGPIRIFKYHEVCEYFVDMSFCGAQTPNAQAINLDVWNSISSSDQKVIEELSAEMHGWFVSYLAQDAARLRALYESEGITHIELSPAEQARIRDMTAEKIWAKWIATANEQGVPGEEFLTRYKAIVAELSK